MPVLRIGHWSLVIRLLSLFLVAGAGLANVPNVHADENAVNSRRPANDVELKSWLENLLWRHRFSQEETRDALGLSPEELAAAVQRFDIRSDNAPAIPPGKVFVLPYPGGRHPRIGFLDGALNPQRETKVSIFTPWQPADGSRADYVVADVPEAIWSNLGLTYLAHTHVPTIWSKQGVELEPREWTRNDDGSFEMHRRLPNGIEFATTVRPGTQHVSMEMTLKNGTDQPLTDLRVQNCVMLKGAAGFTEQTNDNKLFRAPYAAARDTTGERWVITAWMPNHRTWGNPPCPCLHSDPKFPDCAPGETQHLAGWLSFYEGRDIEGELDRIEALQWWQPHE